MKIVFFGTPRFAAEILEHLVKNGHDIIAVVTRPDKAKGRKAELLPPDVKVVAEKILPNAKIFQPAKASNSEFLEDLKKLKCDLFLVVAYGQILKQELLDIPSKGCINVHASLLPSLRGAAPIQRAIMQGFSETGITIMQMTLGLDAGDMLYQLKMPLPLSMNASELILKLIAISKEALDYVFKNFNSINPVKQDVNLVTYAPKIEIEDAKINWNKSAFEIHNLIRGVVENPGAWCNIKLKGVEKTLKIYTSSICDKQANAGSIIEFNKNNIIIACGSGSIDILSLQLEGRKITTAKDFACGYKASDIQFLF
jgi:methionyl-tRNA formyltransferase